MLISLFENLAEEILPRWFGDCVAHIFDRRENEITRYHQMASTLRTNPEQSCFLLYCRSRMVARAFSVANWNDPKEHGRLSSLIGDGNLKGFLRMAARTPIDGELYGELPAPRNMHQRLVHFRGNNEGAPGMPIPEIRRYRIPPNAWLPDVLHEFEIIEAEFKKHLPDVPDNIRYPTQNQVPRAFIRADSIGNSGITLIKEYKAGDTRYAWFNLNSPKNVSEANAMGHCANTNSPGAVLFSFRSLVDLYIEDEGQLVRYHRPHLTAAINPQTKMCFELRGGGNTKPKEEYHPYIMDLVRQGIVTRFLYSSYENQHQFKLAHLNDEMKNEYLDLIGFNNEPDGDTNPVDIFDEAGDQTAYRDTDTWIFFNGNGVVDEQRWRSAVRSIQQACLSHLGWPAYEVDVNDHERITMTAESLTYRELLDGMIETWEGWLSRDMRMYPDRYINPSEAYLTNIRTFISQYSEQLIQRNVLGIPPDVRELAYSVGMDALRNGEQPGQFFREEPIDDWMFAHTLRSFYQSHFATPFEQVMSSIIEDGIDRISIGDNGYGYWVNFETNLDEPITVHADLGEQWRVYIDGQNEEEVRAEYGSLYWLGDGGDIDNPDTYSYENCHRDAGQLRDLEKLAGTVTEPVTGWDTFREYLSNENAPGQRAGWISAFLKQH